jgi:hypothetical protein
MFGYLTTDTVATARAAELALGHSARSVEARRSGHGLPPGFEALECGLEEKEEMMTRHQTKLVHEGNYVAEVDVELALADDGWAPYLTLDDAYKLDDVRDALRRGDVKAASRIARVFTLTPVAV